MPPDKTVDTVLMIIAGGLLVMGLGSFALGWVVRTYDRLRTGAMSSTNAGYQNFAPSSLETDARQTRDAPALPKMKAEELLTLCRLMRVHGIGREEAQAAFTASGLPFNNNVWASAKPSPAAHLTPVAGRPTDADFPYQPIDN